MKDKILERIASGKVGIEVNNENVGGVPNKPKVKGRY